MTDKPLESQRRWAYWPARAIIGFLRWWCSHPKVNTLIAQDKNGHMIQAVEICEECGAKRVKVSV